MQPTKSERSSLQLPSWNEGIRQAFDDPRDKAAAKAGHHQTAGPRRVLASAQVTGVYNQRQLAPTDPTAPRADVLDSLPDAREAEYWLRRAAAAEEGGRPEEAERLLMGALERDVRPATAVAHALHELHARWEGAPVATGEPPACLLLLGCLANPVPAAAAAAAAARKTATPLSRTGLTGKAQRVPAHLADTPGAEQPVKFKSVLKKLSFFDGLTPLDAAAPPAPAAPTSAAARPHTATKQLHFGAAKATPQTEGAADHAAAGGAKSGGGRRVTFGGEALGPSPGYRPPRRSSLAPFRTPPSFVEEAGAILEGEEGEGEGLSGASVNSRNAGATPFSALFRKYEVPSTPEGPSPPQGTGTESRSPMPGAEGSPSWERLSTASVPESIKVLASKYGQAASVADAASPSPAGAASQAAAEEEEAGQPREVTPNTAVAQVLGPLMAAALQGMQQAAQLPQHQQAPPPTPPAAPAAGAAPRNLDFSPVGPGLAAAAEAPRSLDGVPRGRDGIPLATPGTVTVQRGSRAAPDRDDGLAADLFRSFDTPEAEADDREEAEEAAPASGGSAGGFSFAAPGAAPRAPASPGAASEGTPDLQPRSAAKPARPTPTPTPAPRPAGPSPPLWRSVVAGGPLAADGSPALGPALRVPSPSPSPASATHELRALMAGVALSAPSPAGGLEAVRATPAQRQELGADRVATPVRRSGRGGSPAPAAAAVLAALEATEFAYVPNAALAGEAAAVAAEAAVPPAASPRRTRGSMLAPSEAAAAATPGRRYATRSASTTPAPEARAPAPAPAPAREPTPPPPLSAARRSARLATPPPADATPAAVTPAPRGAKGPTPRPATRSASKKAEQAAPESAGRWRR